MRSCGSVPRHYAADMLQRCSSTLLSQRQCRSCGPALHSCIRYHHSTSPLHYSRKQLTMHFCLQVLSDSQGGGVGDGPRPVLGDALVLLGALLYAVVNITEEHLLSESAMPCNPLKCCMLWSA